MATVDAKAEKKQDDQHIEEPDFVENIFKVIYRFFKLIIVIIFYPLIWIVKEFARMGQLLSGGKKNRDLPLSHSEIAFVESLPMFMTVLGTLVAIVVGAIAWIRFNDTINQFLTDLTAGLEGLINIVKTIWGAIVAILTFIYELFKAIVTGVIELFGILLENPLFSVLVVMIIVAVLVALYLIISETEYLNILLRKIGYIGLGITDFPRWLYDVLDNLWLNLMKRGGRRLLGGKSLTTKTRFFYQKIVWLVIFYALWNFIWGVMLLINEILTPNNDFTNNNEQILATTGNLLLILFASGIVSGFILSFVLVFLLTRISGNKYKADGKLIDQLRHESLVNYLEQKISKYPVLTNSRTSKITDIQEEDFKRHWTDNKLSKWKLFSKHIVNKGLFDAYLEKIDKLENEGLEKESEKDLTKAIEMLSNLQKKFGNVPELNNQIEERKKYLYEDIADLRGQLAEGS